MSTTQAPSSAPGRGSAQSRYSTRCVAAVDAEQARKEARAARWRLRSRMGASGVTRLDRVAGCGRAAVDWYVPVLVKDGVASFAGIITCGSVSACPVCSAKVRQEKAIEVEWRAKQWLQDGHGLLFVTLTLPHTMGDDLEDLLDGVLGSWRSMQQDHVLRRALRDAGYVGPLRALEVTHGYNGWHPHLHLLLWFDAPLSAETAAALEDSLFVSWADQVESRLERRPSREHGVRADRVGAVRDSDAVAQYLVKMQDGYEPTPADARWSAAREMTRADLKRARKSSRTPFQLAEAACTGDKRAQAAWRRYERAMHGRRVLQWGQKLYGVLKAEQTPPEVEGGAIVTVLELTRLDWNVLRSYNRQLQLLQAVEHGGAMAGLAVLRALCRRVAFDHARGRPPRAPADFAAAVVRQRINERQQVAQ